MNVSQQDIRNLKIKEGNQPTYCSDLNQALSERDEDRVVYILRSVYGLNVKLDIEGFSFEDYQKGDTGLINCYIQACAQGYLDVVRFLIQDLSTDPSERFNSAIKAAAINWKTDILKYLSQDTRCNPQLLNINGESFLDKVGYTSDHVYRILEIDSINIFTWNLLMQCNNANNPFRCTEDEIDYIERKRLQFKVIRSLCLTCDIGLLQEVDFLRRETVVHNCMCIMFDDMLESLGFSKIIYTKRNLAIIYRNHKVKPIGGYSTKLLHVKRRKSKNHNAGLKLLLCQKFIINNHQYLIHNAHLSYCGDFKKDLESLLRHQNIDVIIGGDFNHVSEKGIPIILSSSLNATNFDSRQKNILKDDRCGINKCYDAFLCSSIEEKVVRVRGYHSWDCDENGVKLIDDVNYQEFLI